MLLVIVLRPTDRPINLGNLSWLKQNSHVFYTRTLIYKMCEYVYLLLYEFLYGGWFYCLECGVYLYWKPTIYELHDWSYTSDLGVNHKAIELPNLIRLVGEEWTLLWDQLQVPKPQPWTLLAAKLETNINRLKGKRKSWFLAEPKRTGILELCNNGGILI